MRGRRDEVDETTRVSTGATASADAAKAQRIDHVGVLVRDIAAAARYFVERFGMSVATVSDLADGSARLAYLDAGDTTLQLVQPLRDGPLAKQLAERGEGLHHVCFLVDGLEAALAELPGEVDRVGAIYMGGRQCRVVFTSFRPSGVLVELTEPPREQGPA